MKINILSFGHGIEGYTGFSVTEVTLSVYFLHLKYNLIFKLRLIFTHTNVTTLIMRNAQFLQVLCQKTKYNLH